MKFPAQQAEEEVAVANRKRPPGLKPSIFDWGAIAGLKTRFPGLKSGAGTKPAPPD